MRRVPGLSHMLELLVELDRLRAERDRTLAERAELHRVLAERDASLTERDTNLAELKTTLANINLDRASDFPSRTEDQQPWRHPFLTSVNVARFREYSEQVWQVAAEHAVRRPELPRMAFNVNLAQSMYNWARLARNAGADVELFPSPLDTNAISSPAWEDYDGEFGDVHGGAEFLKHVGTVDFAVPVRRLEMADRGLLNAYRAWLHGDRGRLQRLVAPTPSLRPEPFFAYDGIYPYFDWARQLAEFDVSVVASIPIPAYLSGRPYLALTVGGDLIFDCGRGDSYGRIMATSFNAARFLVLTNPHVVGQCRRLGFRNALYLPFLMDDERYSPGHGAARERWEAKLGKGVYVLAAARIDNHVKGNGSQLLEALAEAAKRRPELRFVFLGWGHNAAELQAAIQARGLEKQFWIIPPVGKKRLIDYYRSADIVLDQMVWGYYGATGLEAAAVGKPIVMMLRTEHYAPLYRGDVAPVVNVTGPAEVTEALEGLAKDASRRAALSAETRSWLVRNHGAKVALPRLLATARLAADQVALPLDLQSPLADEVSEEELRYHQSCLVTNS